MNDNAQTISAIAASMGVIAAFTVWILNLQWRIAQNNLKVDTLWDFFLRRGKEEALLKGVARMNSPFVVTEEAKSALEPIADELRELLRKLGRRLVGKDLERELAFRIEMMYGDQVVELVCKPGRVTAEGLSEGACLHIAMAVARSGD